MNSQSPAPRPAATGHRPRIALLGEFSAGKSTLANVFFGRDMSPVQVTATQMPPVWYSLGPDGRSALTADDREVPVDSTDPDALAAAGATALKVSLEAEVLEFCDLIDMPGTSDPNLAMETWAAMMARVDGVIWLTPASQAWRQSEAALWDEVGADYADRSLLLVTRMDKIAEQRDRDRILARLRREVAGQFREVLGVSLTDALRAGEDEARLEACGAAALVASLMALIEDLSPGGIPAFGGQQAVP